MAVGGVLLNTANGVVLVFLLDQINLFDVFHCIVGIFSHH